MVTLIGSASGSTIPAFKVSLFALFVFCFNFISVCIICMRRKILFCKFCVRKFGYVWMTGIWKQMVFILIVLKFASKCFISDVVHGVEYGFGAHDHSTTGIFEVEPKQCPGFTFRKSILIGRTDLGPKEVRTFMEKLAEEYSGNTYHLITKNCNHFCNDVCLKLTKKPIPRWVNRLARLGKKFISKCFVKIFVLCFKLEMFEQILEHSILSSSFLQNGGSLNNWMQRIILRTPPFTSEQV